MIDDLAGIRCARCGRLSPIIADELTGDGRGDPALLVVIVPPDGWIGDPDSDGIIHGDCAFPDEIEEWMAGLALAERMMCAGDDVA